MGARLKVTTCCCNKPIFYPIIIQKAQCHTSLTIKYTHTLTEMPLGGEEHAKTKYLNHFENLQLHRRIKTDSIHQISLFTGIAQILEANKFGSWKIIQTGILCFIKDHKLCTFWIKLYSLTDYSVLWQMECYIELQIKVPKQKFVTFDGLKTRTGVNFHCETECFNFVKILSEKVCRTKKLPFYKHLGSLNYFQQKLAITSPVQVSKIRKFYSEENNRSIFPPKPPPRTVSKKSFNKFSNFL